MGKGAEASLLFLSQLSSASIPLSCRSFVSQEVEAGDYSTVRVLEGKVVVVLDPWYDADLNPNRAKEKRYAFDVVFDEDINQTEVYQQTARGLVDEGSMATIPPSLPTARPVRVRRTRCWDRCRSRASW